MTLADADARRRIAEDLDGSLFVEAGAGSGKTTELVNRVIGLLHAGVELQHVASITFTEKAAAELRDRVRRRIERALAHGVDRELLQRALDQLDGAAIGTLHAFCRRLLSERPVEAGLPPRVTVLDEVTSEVRFDERFARFYDDLLSDPAWERTITLADAAGVKPGDYRALAVAFDDNWDLLDAAVPWQVAEVPIGDLTGWLGELAAIVRERDHCLDADDRMLRRLDELQRYADRIAAADEGEALELLAADRPSFRVGTTGAARNWPAGRLAALRQRIVAAGQQRDAIRNAVQEACIRQIAVAVKRFTRVAAEARRADSELEFHDLLVLARDLLRGPHGPVVRGEFRDRYRRLLLDEFQDTDPIQAEVAVLLASDDPNAGSRAWTDIAALQGRLFVVGDPKQSIYRFRRADIRTFLDARKALAGGPVHLVTNFRSAAPVLAWVNYVFERLIVEEAGSQPAYQALSPDPQRPNGTSGPAVTLLGEAPHAAGTKADELRELEAADVAGLIERICREGWAVLDPLTREVRPACLADIAVLLPARTSLRHLEDALIARGIPYRAETSSLVYATAEVRNLFAALRAVADPSDQLVLVTALRSPLFGCGDDDLVTFHVAGGRLSIVANQPDGVPADHPVLRALRYLRELHDAVPWSTPSELLDRLIRDRRMLELALGVGRPREVWRRLRFVVDQARAWSDGVSGTLREYLQWARLQASEHARVAETVLPETDDDAVRILTVHGAKGLEFPIAILSGTSSQPQARRGVAVLWDRSGGTAGFRIRGDVATREYADLAPIDERMGFHERLRLLYVACTRARDHLVVSLHRVAPRPDTDEQRWTAAQLLAKACADAPHQIGFAPEAPESPDEAVAVEAASVPEDEPDLETWEAERQAALASAAIPDVIAATGVAALAVEITPEADDLDEPAAGLAKFPRDLELPPWMKGRYGTAIGRAVHAVLQTINLATGDGIDAAVAAQAAAEGVIGREATIRRLAAAALSSPTVQRAASRPRWRETYVAVPVTTASGRVLTLEGYIDLLYRDDDGLVVVDYKTASAGADFAARTATYRLQGASYALAVANTTDEPVCRVVFVYLTPRGGLEYELAGLDDAMSEALRLLDMPSTAANAPEPSDPIPA